MRLTMLLLVDDAGHQVVLHERFGLIAKEGKLLKDIMHWQLITEQDLLITTLIAKMSTGVRRQIRQLTHLLITNYPTILHPRDTLGLVRYTVKGESTNRPELQLNAHRELIDDGVMVDHEKPIRSAHDLHLAVQQQLGPDRNEVSVHPHPRLARAACLRQGDKNGCRLGGYSKTIFRCVTRRRDSAKCTEAMKDGGKQEAQRPKG